MTPIAASGPRFAYCFIAMDITDLPIDVTALAASMGIAARRVPRAADIAAAVEDGVTSREPSLAEDPVGFA